MSVPRVNQVSATLALLLVVWLWLTWFDWMHGRIGSVILLVPMDFFLVMVLVKSLTNSSSASEKLRPISERLNRR